MSTTALSARRFDAYAVRKYADKTTGEERTDWQRIGVAWRHTDGQGLNIHLTASPVDGTIVLRVPKQREASNEANDAPAKKPARKRAAA